MADDSRGEFDIGPADEMQRKYGWHAENRPLIRVGMHGFFRRRRALVWGRRWTSSASSLSPSSATP